MLKFLKVILIMICISAIANNLLAWIYHLNKTVTSTKKTYGPQTLPRCGKMPFIKPKPWKTPKWVQRLIVQNNPNKTALTYQVEQQLISKNPIKPQKVQTGLGLMALEKPKNTYIGLSRKIEFDKFSKATPHKTEQMVEFYDANFFPKPSGPCAIGYGADVRIFQHLDQVWGYTILTATENKPIKNDMILFNLNTGRAYAVVVKEWITFNQFGKNWSPFSRNGELWFIHTLAPKLIMVRIGDFNDKPAEFKQTNIGKLSVVYGTPKMSKAHINTRAIHRRGSTHGITFDNYVWGIGHISDYSKREENHSQTPFLWYIDLDDPTPVAKFVEMHNPEKRFIFPMSILTTSHNELKMMATDSYRSWFHRKTINAIYPLEHVKNTLFKIIPP